MKVELPIPTLMFVTAPHERLEQIVQQAIAGGVNVVQWRDSVPSPSRRLADAVHIFNSALGAAVDRKAHGIHLKEEGESIESARAIAGDVLIGRSVHSVEAAQFAEREGADYLIAGNIFETSSHPELAAAGIAFLGAVCESVSIPVLAIGGIKPEEISQCVAAGAAGIAIRSPILEASDPAEVAARYARELRSAFSRGEEEA